MPRRSPRPLPNTWPALIAWLICADQRAWRRAVIAAVVIGVIIVALVLVGHLASLS